MKRLPGRSVSHLSSANSVNIRLGNQWGGTGWLHEVSNGVNLDSVVVSSVQDFYWFAVAKLWDFVKDCCCEADDEGKALLVDASFRALTHFAPRDFQLSFLPPCVSFVPFCLSSLLVYVRT